MIGRAGEVVHVRCVYSGQDSLGAREGVSFIEYIELSLCNNFHDYMTI